MDGWTDYQLDASLPLSMIMMRDGGTEQKMVLVVVISFNVCTVRDREITASGGKKISLTLLSTKHPSNTNSQTSSMCAHFEGAVESHDRHDRKLVCNQQLRHGTQQAGRHSQTHTGFLYTQPRSISFVLHSVGFAVIDSRWALFDAKCVHHTDARTHTQHALFSACSVAISRVAGGSGETFVFLPTLKRNYPHHHATLSLTRFATFRAAYDVIHYSLLRMHTMLPHIQIHAHTAGRLN